jgi:hypothetical protein
VYIQANRAMYGRLLALLTIATALAACDGSTGGAATNNNASAASTAASNPNATPSTASTTGSAAGTIDSGSASSSTAPVTASSPPTPVTPAPSTTGTASGTSPAPPIATETVTLSWAAPTENTDGTVLTDLAGYSIYYGTSAATMTNMISIDSIGMLTYVVNDLSPGTWYFAVVAVSASGMESSPSKIVEQTI